ncbi:unnamed protein product [Periconia digitata]|uniref:Uncharacterized protein n=1 Tax=Periconia digitata TaxID=1303443 RepID=A0A9W4XLD8_9PLEO|nr:unnamed protein product [Periconia digitata]
MYVVSIPRYQPSAGQSQQARKAPTLPKPSLPLLSRHGLAWGFFPVYCCFAVIVLIVVVAFLSID